MKCKWHKVIQVWTGGWWGLCLVHGWHHQHDEKPWGLVRFE
ncbi:hypothetical protein LCGC14_1430250 [marine sediment metagenome]|uniref:Uncharacterized protein n=1 Tax=marine sediment metagenome TaxID=412755 RepID=A0A0F9MQK6_9ZZZZ